MGVSVWVWVAGLAVSVASVAAVMQAVNAGPPSSAAHGSAGGGVSRKVDAMGSDALLMIRLRVAWVASVAEAEADLRCQTTAGEAALATIRLNEKKQELAAHDAEVDEAMESLRAEGSTGMEMASQLEEFARYAKQVVYEARGSLGRDTRHPDTVELLAESLRIRSTQENGISLDDVRGGRYESEVMRRIDAERQELVERFRRESGAH